MQFHEVAGMYYPAGVLRGGDTMVEVGSFDGKNLYESALYRPHVQYQLFEPSPVLFPELQQRFHDDGNVACHQVAIAGTSGPTTFYMKEDRGTGNGIYAIDGASEATIEGLTFYDAFDRFGIRDVRLMLVNCEGAEFDIFTPPLGFAITTEWMTVSFHRDKHPACHDGRSYVERLRPRFETVAWFHEETRCQIWVGHNRRAT